MQSRIMSPKFISKYSKNNFNRSNIGNSLIAVETSIIVKESRDINVIADLEVVLSIALVAVQAALVLTRNFVVFLNSLYGLNIIFWKS